MMNRDDKKAELVFKQHTTVIDFRCYLLQQAVAFQRGVVLGINAFTLVEEKWIERAVKYILS